MDYSICCNGDVCTGDSIIFKKAIYKGSFRNPKFSHFETVEGLVLHESYGELRGQHTFTIQTAQGLLLIKGRNLYKYGVKRKQWTNEALRQAKINEKHERGQQARLKKLYARYTSI